MGEWNYKVPQIKGSGYRSNTVGDVGYPRIGIYCEGIDGARHDLFLIGSFVVSDAIAESLTASWHWTSTYLTGDGYQVRLRHQTGSRASTLLVDDEVWDPAGEHEALARYALDGLDTEMATRQMGRIDHARQVMRSMPDLRCRAHVAAGSRCRLRVDARAERTRDVLTWLWQNGFRETSLETLGMIYRRVASNAPRVV